MIQWFKNKTSLFPAATEQAVYMEFFSLLASCEIGDFGLFKFHIMACTGIKLSLRQNHSPSHLCHTHRAGMHMHEVLGFLELRIFSSWFSWLDFSFLTSERTAFSDQACSIWFSPIDPLLLRYWRRRFTEVFPNINFHLILQIVWSTVSHTRKILK